MLLGHQAALPGSKRCCHDPASHWPHIVFFLQNPLESLEALKVLLGTYSKSSGYKVNENKTMIMGLNIDEELRKVLEQCRMETEEAMLFGDKSFGYATGFA